MKEKPFYAVAFCGLISLSIVAQPKPKKEEISSKAPIPVAAPNATPLLISPSPLPSLSSIQKTKPKLKTPSKKPITKSN